MKKGNNYTNSGRPSDSSRTATVKRHNSEVSMLTDISAGSIAQVQNALDSTNKRLENSQLASAFEKLRPQKEDRVKAFLKRTKQRHQALQRINSMPLSEKENRSTDANSIATAGESSRSTDRGRSGNPSITQPRWQSPASQQSVTSSKRAASTPPARKPAEDEKMFLEILEDERKKNVRAQNSMLKQLEHAEASRDRIRSESKEREGKDRKEINRLKAEMKALKEEAKGLQEKCSLAEAAKNHALEQVVERNTIIRQLKESLRTMGHDSNDHAQTECRKLKQQLAASEEKRRAQAVTVDEARLALQEGRRQWNKERAMLKLAVEEATNRARSSEEDLRKGKERRKSLQLSVVDLQDSQKKLEDQIAEIEARSQLAEHQSFPAEDAETSLFHAQDAKFDELFEKHQKLLIEKRDTEGLLRQASDHVQEVMQHLMKETAVRQQAQQEVELLTKAKSQLEAAVDDLSSTWQEHQSNENVEAKATVQISELEKAVQELGQTFAEVEEDLFGSGQGTVGPVSFEDRFKIFYTKVDTMKNQVLGSLQELQFLREELASHEKEVDLIREGGINMELQSWKQEMEALLSQNLDLSLPLSFDVVQNSIQSLADRADGNTQQHGPDPQMLLQSVSLLKQELDNIRANSVDVAAETHSALKGLLDELGIEFDFTDPFRTADAIQVLKDEFQKIQKHLKLAEERSIEGIGAQEFGEALRAKDSEISKLEGELTKMRMLEFQASERCRELTEMLGNDKPNAQCPQEDDIESLKKEVMKQLEDIQQVNEQQQQLKKERDDAKAELQAFKGKQDLELSFLSKEMESLKAQNSLLDSHVLELQQQLKESEQHKDLESVKQIEILKKSVQEQVENVQRYSQECKELEFSRDAALTQLQVLKEEYGSKASEDGKALIEKLEATLQENLSLSKELNGVKMELEMANVQANVANDQIKSAQNQSSALQERLNSTVNENEELAKELKEVGGKLEVLKLSEDMKGNQVEQERLNRSALEHTLSQLSMSTNQKEADRTELKAQLHEVEKELQSKSAQHKNAEAECSLLKEKLNSTLEKNNSLEKDLKDANGQIEILKVTEGMKSNQLHSSQSLFQQESSKLQHALEAQEQMAKELKAKEAALMEEKESNQASKEKIYHLENAVMTLQDLNEEQVRVLARLEQQRDELLQKTQLLDAMVIDHEKGGAEKENLCKMLLDQQKDICEKLHQTIENLETDKDKAQQKIQDLGKSLSSLEDQNKSLCEQVQQTEAHNSKLKEEINNLKKELDDLKNQHVDIHQIIKEKQNQIEELQQSKASMQEVLEENKVLEETAQSQNAQLEDICSTLKDYDDKAKSLQVMLEVEKAQKADLLEMKKKFQEATVLLRDQQQQLYEYEDHISQYQEADELLQLELRKSAQKIAELHRQKEDTEERNNALRNQVDSIPRDMTVALAENRALNNDLEKKGKQLKQLKSEHETHLKQQEIDFKNYIRGFEVEKEQLLQRIQDQSLTIHQLTVHCDTISEASLNLQMPSQGNQSHSPSLSEKYSKRRASMNDPKNALLDGNQQRSRNQECSTLDNILGSELQPKNEKPEKRSTLERSQALIAENRALLSRLSHIDS